MQQMSVNNGTFVSKYDSNGLHFQLGPDCDVPVPRTLDDHFVSCRTQVDKRYFPVPSRKL